MRLVGDGLGLSLSLSDAMTESVLGGMEDAGAHVTAPPPQRHCSAEFTILDCGQHAQTADNVRLPQRLSQTMSTAVTNTALNKEQTHHTVTQTAPTIPRIPYVSHRGRHQQPPSEPDLANQRIRHSQCASPKQSGKQRRQGSAALRPLAILPTAADHSDSCTIRGHLIFSHLRQAHVDSRPPALAERHPRVFLLRARHDGRSWSRQAGCVHMSASA